MVSRRHIDTRHEFAPKAAQMWQSGPDGLDGADRDRRNTLVLAAMIALVFGGAVLVFGMVVGPFVTALLCSLLLVSVVGLAVAML